MICPQCQSEYREGILACADCNVPLVNDRLDSSFAGSPLSDLQLVFETKSPKLLEEIVKSLELEEIPYLVQLGTALHFRIAGNLEWQAVLHVSPQHTAQVQQIIEDVHSKKNRPAADCPFCKTPLDDSEQVIKCDSCRTSHHLGCWYERGGCSVFGCKSEMGHIV